MVKYKSNEEYEKDKVKVIDAVATCKIFYIHTFLKEL